MLRIRLRRVGAKKQPSYRIVVAESTAPRDGKFVENIGFYNPRTDPETVKIDEGRALHWLSVGASPSDSVARIFKTHGTMDRFTRLREGAALDTLVAEAAAAVATKAPEVKAVPVVEVVQAEAVEDDEEDVTEEPELVSGESAEVVEG